MPKNFKEQATGHEALAYRVEEVAHLARLGRSTIYELIGAGELAAFKVGARCLVARSELERFVSERTEDARRHREVGE